MALISDWLGYLAWRHGLSLPALRRTLNKRAVDGAWLRRAGVSIGKNTITNVLKGHTKGWHDSSRAFFERVLTEDLGVDCVSDNGYDAFAATIGSDLAQSLPEETSGRDEAIRNGYVGLYDLYRQSTSGSHFNRDLFLVVPVADDCVRAVLYAGWQGQDGEAIKYVGNIRLGTEAIYALLVGRSRPENVRYRSLILRPPRHSRVVPGLMTQLTDSTGIPTALPVILKRSEAPAGADPQSSTFSLQALRAFVQAHDRSFPATGPGALKEKQRRYLNRVTPDAEGALSLFS